MPPAESWAGLRDSHRAIHQPSGGNGRLAVAAPMLRRPQRRPVPWAVCRSQTTVGSDADGASVIGRQGPHAKTASRHDSTRGLSSASRGSRLRGAPRSPASCSWRDLAIPPHRCRTPSHRHALRRLRRRRRRRPGTGPGRSHPQRRTLQPDILAGRFERVLARDPDTERGLAQPPATMRDITTHFVGLASGQPGVASRRMDGLCCGLAWLRWIRPQAGDVSQQYRWRRSHRRCTVRGARFARRARM
jgi:hypothetical protein